MNIEFKNIECAFSKNLKTLNLMGKIEKGKFIKISSKGDFGNNNFLDISLKKDPKSQKNF